MEEEKSNVCSKGYDGITLTLIINMTRIEQAAYGWALVHPHR